MATKTGYNMRNHVELAMQRYKRIFGNTMKVRSPPQQKAEAWISASALNRMTNPGIPVSVRIKLTLEIGSFGLILIYSTTPL